MLATVVAGIHVKRCYQFRFHCWFAWSSSKKVFSACFSSFDIVARNILSNCFFPFSNSKIYVYTLVMRNFGFESSTLANGAATFKPFFFKLKLILIGLQGFIDRVWQNNFASTSRYGVQNRLRPLLEPAIISIFAHRYLHGW